MYYWKGNLAIFALPKEGLRMKSVSFTAATLLAATALSGAQAVTVHTSPFLTNVTNFNGFENTVYGQPSNTIYSDGGIDVEFVGTGSLWNTYLYAGNAGWYMNGGGTGYHKISLTGGGTFTGIQFLAGSGYGNAGYSFAYDLRLGGVSVGSGIGGVVGDPLVAYGLSGATFDEVRLQNGTYSSATVNPGDYEALALDNIEIGTAAVPEPAAWALMIVGFGMVGAAARSRRRVAIAA